jgi:hypothetical protein
MKKALRSAIARIMVVGLALCSAQCGELTKQGQAASYLIVQLLEGASGAEPDEFAGTLLSDVVTVVDGAPSVFNDIGRVTFTLGLKDPGPPNSPTTPSPNNAITVTRYRVTFIRADGRNTPGVDVPFPFDGAFTVTVSAEASMGFTLVRNVAKLEAPLRGLAFQPTFSPISTIAEVTFFGHDQTGREVSASGRISVDFGNFADPTSGG